MTTYEPPPGRSVRPATLERSDREALREAGVNGSGGPGRRRGELPLLVVASLVLAFLIKTFLVQAFFIPSSSMVPALEVGDRVLVEKITYELRDPGRGEIVVFRRPGADAPGGVGGAVRSFLEGLGLVQPDDDIDLIKRVIGLPGETVAVTEGRVTIDGEPLAEDDIIPDQRDFPAVTVPEGEYYLLGDNRTNSDDSRYSLGTVPRDHVVGRAFVILWPPSNVAVSLGEEYAAP